MTHSKHQQTAAVVAEFANVALGDERLNRRLEMIVEQIAAAPAESFPLQMQSTAEREALYRFLGNQKVTMTALLASHVGETLSRVRGQSLLRIVHDTTEFVFEGDRGGLGIVERGMQGFFGHFALAVGATEERQTFGVLGLLPYIHRDTKVRRKKSKSKRTAFVRSLPRHKKKSSRWEKLAQDVSAHLPANVDGIHIMDQEADDFALLARLDESRLRFVVRGSTGRLAESHGRSIEEVLSTRPSKVFRTVKLNRRSYRKAQGRHVPRDERKARLHVRWARLALPRPRYGQTDVEELHVNAVHVFEPNPPPDTERIEWLLLTSEPVKSLDDATAVIDHYRARWVVEEYFKALKTGCSFEKRQLTSYAALLRALALFVPMAWHLLALRELSRSSQSVPAQHVFDDEQVHLLRVLLEQRAYELPEEPSVRQAMLGIAALGGHIRNNGDPGWMVLGRGYRKFNEAETIWRVAKSRARSDQS
jgi:hypothetical protein